MAPRRSFFIRRSLGEGGSTNGPKSLLHMQKIFPSTNSSKQDQVAIVIHGLNLNPDAMNPLITELTSCEITVVRLTLSGHGDDPRPLESVTADTWINDLKDCYRFTREQYPNSLIQGIGFSLGAGVLLLSLIHI